MRDRAVRTAEHFGQLKRCKAFESALLAIEDIVPENFSSGIDIDLDGWWSEIHQVIIVPKYCIPASAKNYFDRHRGLIRNITETARQFGLFRKADRIEDYGCHYYIVFRCDSTWAFDKVEEVSA